MSVVTLRIGARDYQVACDTGQEEHLRFLAEEIDERVASLSFGLKGNPGDAMLLVMAGLMMADEMHDLQRENERLSEQVREQTASGNESRMVEMEAAMAITLEEIAQRIEKIADQIEIS